MIELNEFAFPAKDCFRLMLQQRAARAFLVISVLTAYYAGFTRDVMTCLIFTTVVSVGVGIFVCMQSCLLVFTKENKALFQKRKIIFDHEMTNITMEDGCESKTPINHIIRADRTKEYYRLYMNRMSYCAVPLTAFRSEEDRKRFETEILGSKFKTRTSAKFWFTYLLLCGLAAGLGYGLGAVYR